MTVRMRLASTCKLGEGEDGDKWIVDGCSGVGTYQCGVWEALLVRWWV